MNLVSSQIFRERERDRDRERQRERETETERDRQRERDRDRERQRERQRDSKNIFFYQHDVENYNDQVLNFLLFDRHEYVHTESSGL